MKSITYSKISEQKYLQQIRYFNGFNIPQDQINNLCDLSDRYESIFGSSVNVCDLTQQQVFEKYITKDTGLNIDGKDLYLDVSSYILRLLTTSSLESIFLKSGTESLNVSLLTSIDFSGLFNLRKAIQEAKEELVNNPCILQSDFNPSKQLHPFKLLLVKTAVRLIIRLHILDFKIKNVYTSSVFLNSEFLQNDDTLVQYLIDSFLSKNSKFVPIFTEAIIKLLNDDIQNNICFVNPITKSRIKFSKIKYETILNTETLQYVKYLFLTEFVSTNNIFDKFFSRNVRVLNETIPLSKKYKVKNYLLNQLKFYDASNVSNASGVDTADRGRVGVAPLYLYLENVNNQLSVTLRCTVCNLASVKVDFPNSTRSLDISSPEVRNTVNAAFLENTQLNLLLDYVFDLYKFLNISAIYQYHIISCENRQINEIFDTTNAALKVIIKTNLVNRRYDQFDSELECPIDLDFELNGLDINALINAELLKMLLTAPIQIFKGLVETIDPNISIASKIRYIAEAAGAPKLPIIPYSLGLLPAGIIPPPIGIGPPVLPPYGFMYWGIDAGEVAYAYATGDATLDSHNGLDLEFEGDVGIDELSDLLPEECR